MLGGDTHNEEKQDSRKGLRMQVGVFPLNRVGEWGLNTMDFELSFEEASHSDI